MTRIVSFSIAGVGLALNSLLWSLLACNPSAVATTQNQRPYYGEGRMATSECHLLDSTHELCWWNYRYDATQCSHESPCAKAVVFFVDDELGCDAALYGGPRRDIEKILSHYADRGYVAITACLFESKRAAQSLPFHKQAGRISKLLQIIRELEEIQRVWTGEHLLLSGHGHGATAPVVAMFRSHYDGLPHWHGSRFTAACFSEGSYDVNALDNYLYKNRPACGKQRSDLLCSRYQPTAGCSYPLLNSASVTLDSVLDASVSEVRVPHWKLIECGSATPHAACSAKGDGYPSNSIASLCRKVNGQFGYDCQFSAFQTIGYASCANHDSVLASCSDWFEQEILQPNRLAISSRQ